MVQRLRKSPSLCQTDLHVTDWLLRPMPLHVRLAAWGAAAQPLVEGHSGVKYRTQLQQVVTRAGCMHVCRNTDHAANDVRPALEATLQDLHTSYLDLYLVCVQVPFITATEALHPSSMQRLFLHAGHAQTRGAECPAV